jgi:hypothetical protein
VSDATIDSSTQGIGGSDSRVLRSRARVDWRRGLARAVWWAHLACWLLLLAAVTFLGYAVPLMMVAPLAVAVAVTALAYGPRDWRLVGSLLAWLGAQVAAAVVGLSSHGGTIVHSGEWEWRIPWQAPLAVRFALLLVGLFLPLVASVRALRRLRRPSPDATLGDAPPA